MFLGLFEQTLDISNTDGTNLLESSLDHPVFAIINPEFPHPSSNGSDLVPGGYEVVTEGIITLPRAFHA